MKNKQKPVKRPMTKAELRIWEEVVVSVIRSGQDAETAAKNADQVIVSRREAK
jgi:hypothetical protein